MSRLRGHLLVLATYLLLSAVWTWPTMKLTTPLLPTRHFDLLPTVWLVDVGPEVFPSLVHGDSLWPEGEGLGRLDSYVLLFLAWLNQGLLPPLDFLRLLIWAGPALSAFAAERCAVLGFGVRRPWSWFAGVSYGFSGVMASAVLEGQAYSLVNPWLPLLLLALWKGLNPGGRLVHGLAAGACWAMAHLTSAYFGFLGILLILVLGVRALLWLQDPKLVLKHALGVAALAVPAGLLQIWLFSQGQSESGFSPGAGELVRGSITLAELLGWVDSIDLAYHSVNAPLHWGVFWLMMLAPALLDRRRLPWRLLMGLALFGLLLSLGPLAHPHHSAPAPAVFTSPMSPLLSLPGVTYFRFPYRFAWIYSLASGLVAAMVLQALAERTGRRWAWVMLPVALVDVLLGVGLPLRLREGIAPAPSAYAAAPEGWVVADVYAGRLALSIAQESESAGDAYLWARNLSCLYQVSHQRPIPSRCISTAFTDLRSELQDELYQRVLDYADRMDTESIGEVGPWLAERGVGAVAVHADFLRPRDRDQVIEGLTAALGPPAADSDDGGERIVLFVVPEALTRPPPSREEALGGPLPTNQETALPPARGDELVNQPGERPPDHATPQGPPPDQIQQR